MNTFLCQLLVQKLASRVIGRSLETRVSGRLLANVCKASSKVNLALPYCMCIQSIFCSSLCLVLLLFIVFYYCNVCFFFFRPSPS